MQRLKSLLIGLGSLAVGVLFVWLAVATAQQAPQYPLDDKLANQPAPWTVPGKWGKRGNWGRWGEEDKRGMLNYITPEMIVKAVGLVKQGKVYALGEELHNDVPRVITPTRVGIQVIQERDGYDRTAAKSGEFDPKRGQGAASFTFMHNHTGTHLDTFAHIYRENALYNNMPAPKVEWGFPTNPKYTRKAFGFLGLPLHTDFIWNRGAYIIEILNLDELARDQAYEFLFVLGPLLLRGGIGVPVNPIAIR